MNTIPISAGFKIPPLEEFRRLGLALTLSAAAHAVAVQWLPQPVRSYEGDRFEYSLTVRLAPESIVRISDPIQKLPAQANTADSAGGAANGRQASRLVTSGAFSGLETVRETLPPHASQENLAEPVWRTSGNAGDTTATADRAPDTQSPSGLPAEAAENGAEDPTQSSNTTLQAMHDKLAAARDPAALPLLDYYYAPNEVDQPARAVGDGLLQYPREALNLRVSGAVRLRLFIDESGSLNRAEVLSAAPRGVFEQAALEAVHSMRFSPASKDGHPVRSQRTVEITFDPDPRALRNLPSSR